MSASAEEQQKLQLAVTKAAFSASLSSPGDPKVPTQLVGAFLSLLKSVTSHPSQRNVKEARKWILENCKLAKQVTACMRFMSAFSATLTTSKARLSLLYVINDVLFHATNTFLEEKAYVAPATLQYLPAMVNAIRSAQDVRVDPLIKVLRLWRDKRYFSDDDIARLMGGEVTEQRAETRKNDQPGRKPIVKPTMLGINGDPHWLLPVSCMLEVMDYTNGYEPIASLNVKAIRLSEKTDPDLMDYVESFESSIHDWRFKEEEGSEGEEFDGEGWNLRFWRDHEGREQRRDEGRIRRQSIEKIGRTDVFTGKPSKRKVEISRGRSRQRDRRSYSQSSDSRSRSRSPQRHRERERSYSRSPPRRRRPQSRTPSRSPSPRRRWSPPPRDRPSQHNVSVQSHQTSSTNPPHAGGLQPQYSYGTAPQHYPQATSSQQHPYTTYPSSSGYYSVGMLPQGTSSAPWDQQGEYRPPAPPHWTQPSMGSSQNYSKNAPSGEYGKGGNDMQNRSWK